MDGEGLVIYFFFDPGEHEAIFIGLLEGEFGEVVWVLVGGAGVIVRDNGNPIGDEVILL